MLYNLELSNKCAISIKKMKRKFNDNALTTLYLLIAISDPKEKDKMINWDLWLIIQPSEQIR